MGWIDAAADPDSPEWGDQDRDVGDGADMPRVLPSCALVVVAAGAAMVWLAWLVALAVLISEAR